MLGDAYFAAIEECECLLDRLGVELPALPELVDALRDLHHVASSRIRQ